MKTALKNHLILLFVVCLTGCTTTLPFKNIPVDSVSFEKPPDHLRAEYSEIAEFEKTFRGFSGNTPYADDLTARWGEPFAVKKDWKDVGLTGATLLGCGIAFGPIPAAVAGGTFLIMRPYPFEYAYWKKGNYCIEVLISRTMMHSYKRTIGYWKWHELASTHTLPDTCK